MAGQNPPASASVAEAGQARPAAGESFTVQVGAFSSRLAAQRALVRLHQSFADSWILTSEDHDETFYRVVSGSFASREDAELRRQALSERGFNTYIGTTATPGPVVAGQNPPASASVAEAGQARPAAGESFTVQVGAFSSRLSALQTLVRLHQSFADSWILTSEDHDEAFYRVVSGSFASREAAELRRQALSERGFNTYIRTTVTPSAEAAVGKATVGEAPSELRPAPAAELARSLGSRAAEDLTAAVVAARDVDDPDGGGWTTDLFGRPLVFSAEYTVKPRSRSNFSIGARDDDKVRVTQRLDLAALYRITPRTSLLLETKVLHNADLVREDGETASDQDLQRGESWVLFDRIANSGFGLQIGRQQFRDSREWWWDEDLDAIRVYYSWSERLYAEVALAERMIPLALDDSRIDPEADGLRRILAQLTWKVAPRLKLEAFFLKQNDRSHSQADKELTGVDGEDEVDADLSWFGLRVLGKHKVNSGHRLYYWLDGAVVRGSETVIDFDDGPTPETIVADDPFNRDVEGWGLDTGVTWKTEWRLRPSFTFGYAFGSGDEDPERDSESTDHAFRQTGLGDNNGKFRGVDRFRYYGELMRPELSNMHIATIALGLPMLQESSVELIWHLYRQAEPALFVRDARIRRDRLNGDRDIGQEIDLVFGFEEWEHLEIEFIAALFKAGDAYGADQGTVATNFILQLEWGF